IASHNSETLEIDSRTSDAIALALRAQCPIYTYKNILDDAGIVIESVESDSPQRHQEQKPKSEHHDLSNMGLEELKKELDRAIQIEDYDRAALIRDEINKRS